MRLHLLTQPGALHNPPPNFAGMFGWRIHGIKSRLAAAASDFFAIPCSWNWSSQVILKRNHSLHNFGMVRLGPAKAPEPLMRCGANSLSCLCPCIFTEISHLPGLVSATPPLCLQRSLNHRPCLSWNPFPEAARKEDPRSLGLSENGACSLPVARHL